MMTSLTRAMELNRQNYSMGQPCRTDRDGKPRDAGLLDGKPLDRPAAPLALSRPMMTSTQSPISPRLWGRWRRAAD